MGKEVAVPEQAQVPDLVRPTFDIQAEDIALPNLKIGQFMSEAVQDGDVKFGDLFLAWGQEGPYQVIDKPARFHVLDMRKGKSVSIEGQLFTYRFDDPDAPENAWVTYQYTIVLPQVERDVPAKFLLTRTGRPAAQQINLVLARTAALGPAYRNAFVLDTKERQNDKGKFHVAKVRPVDASPADIELAESLAVKISGRSADVNAREEEPAI